jgi:prepilin-type N-terminal cleavage/methylation domain-containing protein
MSRARGFTALELVLTIALFGMVLGTVSIALADLQNRNALQDSAAAVVDSLRRAEAQALSGHFGDRWGVHFSDGDGCALPATKFHIYRGAAFTSATDTYDTVDLGAGVTVTAVSVGGGCDVSFSRFHGITGSAGTVTLTNLEGATSTVTVNGYGNVVAQ